jgi:pyrimidine-nucleoside phosphorylase
MVAAIAQKRDGEPLSADQIHDIINGYVSGDIPDYQVSALLMAIVLKGMTDEETLALTQAMVESGDQFDMSSLGRRIVDKHSTGGVGDKVSLALGPVVASCGVPVGKMSGRGLGHTGGTLDKLESIPGFNIELDHDQFMAQVRSIGLAIVGQTADIVPADKKLYALRDVTATIESIPLIAASIMSKKLAAGADAIVLDVKVGSGAFMKDIDSARNLADQMIAIGNGAGRTVKVLITDMSTPLGCAVGNALEIAEVRELLHGNGPSDLRELVLSAAATLLSLSDLEISEDEGRLRAQASIEDGSAWSKFCEFVRAQGGDPDAPLPTARIQHVINAPTSGVITQLDALEVGHAAFLLGAGRQTKADVIDHAVGITLHAQLGDRIEAGDALFTVHARTQTEAEESVSALLHAVVISDSPKPATRQSVIFERRG